MEECIDRIDGVRVVPGCRPKHCPRLENLGNQLRYVVLSGVTESVDAAVSGQSEMSWESEVHDRRNPCGISSIHNSNEAKLQLSSQSRAANHSDQKKPEPKQPARFSVNPPPPPPSEKVGEKGRFRDACEGGGAGGEKLKDDNETCILNLEKDALVEEVPERKSCGRVKQEAQQQVSAAQTQQQQVSVYALVVAAATAARGMLLHRGLSSVIALDTKPLASAPICLN
jgi:hypothetical protein